MSSVSNKPNHILLLPSLALGHMKPFVELARLIQKRSSHLKLTILTTPLNVPLIHKLLAQEKEQSSNAASTVIQVRDLPFRSSDHEGLPENVENTYGLGLSGVIKLFRAASSLEAPLRRYIADEIVGKEGSPPLCIITDFFLAWAVDVAISFRCPGFIFSTGGTYGTTAYMCICNELPHRKQTNNDGTFTLSAFPETHRFHLSQLHRYLRAADGTDEWSRFFQPQFRKSMSAIGWLCNTAEELEPLGLSILRNYLNLPVWAIGPTIPLSVQGPADTVPYNNDDPNTSRVLEWLDSQPERSVIYVSFGSQNTITTTQMSELAKGLDESGRRFVWVIRPPFGFDIDGEFRSNEWLPAGFEERVVLGERRGLIVHKWGPQMEILAHKSTGVFLTHCGWNSVVESLSQGIPMIGWPLAAEQAYSSKMLVEEMGVAVELTRGLEGEVTSEDVKRVVGLCFEEGEGEVMKRKAVEMREKVKAALREEGDDKGSSVKLLDDFLQHVVDVSGQLIAA